MKIFSLVILIVVVMWLWPGKDVWSGYFYPDQNNLSNWVEGGNFDSLESCRNWAVNYGYLKSIPVSDYDYECGLNCKYKDGFNVCEKTEQ